MIVKYCVEIVPIFGLNNYPDFENNISRVIQTRRNSVQLTSYIQNLGLPGLLWPLAREGEVMMPALGWETGDLGIEPEKDRILIVLRGQLPKHPFSDLSSLEISCNSMRSLYPTWKLQEFFLNKQLCSFLKV